jgi:phosphatidylinositol 4-kinase B
MQAHLQDLASSDKDSKSFTICQRVLLRCHEIIFEDTPGLTSGPYGTMKVQSRKLQRRKRVKHHLEPALVGIGCVLAGVPGVPKLTATVGNVALEQGRAEDTEGHIRSLEVDDDWSPIASPSHIQTIVEPEPDEEDDAGDEEHIGTIPEGYISGQSQVRPSVSGGKHGILGFKSFGRSRSQRISEAAQTTPSFRRLSNEMRHSEAADDPFGQLDAPSPPSLPFKSSPSLSSTKNYRQSGSGGVVEDILREYDPKARKELLQSHYCRSEVPNYARASRNHMC